MLYLKIAIANCGRHLFYPVVATFTFLLLINKRRYNTVDGGGGGEGEWRGGERRSRLVREN